MITLEYDSNNSGGDWWLSDEDWKTLETFGWAVKWQENGRFLGALATEASKQFENAAEGIKEFERLTNQSASDIGCTCCGPPHNFSFIDEEGNRHFGGPEIVQTEYRFD